MTEKHEGVQSRYGIDMWRKSPVGNFAISSTMCASVFRDGMTNSRKFCTAGKWEEASLESHLLVSAPQSMRQL